MDRPTFRGAKLLAGAALAALAFAGLRARPTAPRARQTAHVSHPAPASPGAPTRGAWSPSATGRARGAGPSLRAEARALRERLDAVSYATGDNAAAQYARFLGALRADRDRATALLVEALRSMSPDERRGPDARPVVYALGAVGDASAVGTLAGMLDEPLPASAPVDHHHDPRAEALVTRSMAIHAMASIAERDADRRTLDAVDARLRSLVAAPDTSAHLVATAVGALRRHAADPAAEVARLESLLGDRRHLAHLEYRSTLPRTPEQETP